ncbi:hypothetical protein [Sporolactobacillus pectinivorans]|uniref:hypothetical protein n=1 Tax=Sporolactobacillus pectinivorans TaxID=1591408 RepID=UPI0012FE4D2F|nr:hypothetical protein [Sporolactobacillus pectinivorans]
MCYCEKNILLLFVPILLLFALSLPRTANALDDSEFAGGDGDYGEVRPIELPGGFDEGGGGRERISYSEPYYIKELDKSTSDQNHIEGSKGNDHKWRYIAKPVNRDQPYVEKAMRNGHRVLENRKVQVYRNDLEIKGHKVSVRYRVIKGKAHISTAWVNLKWENFMKH